MTAIYTNEEDSKYYVIENYENEQIIEAEKYENLLTGDTINQNVEDFSTIDFKTYIDNVYGENYYDEYSTNDILKQMKRQNRKLDSFLFFMCYNTKEVNIMPELPEVETVKNKLKKLILNKQIIDVNIMYSNIIEYPNIGKFKNSLINQTIIDIKRRGKWLIFELTDYYLLSHLRMEGKYIIRNKDDNFEKHEHVEFIFSDNTTLRYKDTRKFGRMYLYKKDEAYNNKPLNELGLEPWDENLNIEYLKEKFKNKKLPIKTLLLDQSIMVGLGNIYVDEVLFMSNLNPQAKVTNLTDINLEDIIKNSRIVLEHAIKLGGTTIRSYESSEGVHGLFQNELLVHGKEFCPNCNQKLEKIKVGGRGTYYCSNCQNEKNNGK